MTGTEATVAGESVVVSQSLVRCLTRPFFLTFSVQSVLQC